MTDELHYHTPDIDEDNEDGEDAEGASSAAAAADRMAADADSPSAGGDAQTPAVTHDHSSSAVGSLERAATAASHSPSASGSLEHAATAATPLSGSDSANEAGGKIRLSEKEQLRELQNLLEGHKEKKSDVFRKLATGDILVRDGKTQHLIMPNNESLTVKPDGSYELDTKQAVKVKSEKGVTTVTFANGDSVEFDSQGIRGIQRTVTGKDGKPMKVAESFARKEEMQHQLRELKPLKPQSGSGENSPNVIREAQPLNPNGSPSEGRSRPNIIRDLQNVAPNRIPESGSNQIQREARPAETPNRLPSELSQEELKKLLQRKR